MNKYIIAAILAVAAVFGFAGGRIGVATAPVTGGYFRGRDAFEPRHRQRVRRPHGQRLRVAGRFALDDPSLIVRLKSPKLCVPF
jgi:hypothetical protein